MVGDARQFARRPSLGPDRPDRFRLSLGICLWLLFGLLCAGAAGSAEVRNAPVPASGPGAQIAVADFDGDHYPDLASVQANSTAGRRTSYCIHLRLSRAAQQSIQVFGPIGGLEIAALDVNGDHAIDLVLTAAWFRRPVAILLNDGHGNFSRVEPSAYSGAFGQSSAHWAGTDAAVSMAAVDPTQWRADVSAPACRPLRARLLMRSVVRTGPGPLRSLFLISHSSRAPPTQTPQL